MTSMTSALRPDTGSVDVCTQLGPQVLIHSNCSIYSDLSASCSQALPKVTIWTFSLRPKPGCKRT